MRDTTRERLERLAGQIQALVNDLKLEPELDTQFCGRALSQCLGMLQLRIEENYGVHLKPNMEGL